MGVPREYYYNHQFRNYIIQFLAVFGGMKVQVGWNEDKEPRLISTPIYYASKDRVVADIKSENTQNKPIRIPTMSAYMHNLELDRANMHGTGGTRRQTYMPTGGSFPDDITVVEQRMPVPYLAYFELSIWASNQQQHMQLMEQILMLFDPTLELQISDEMFDWTKITQIELQGVRPEENMPMGVDRRIIQTTFDFAVPIHLSVPAAVHKKFVKDIYMRIGAVSTAAKNSYDIVAELDAQGIQYDLEFSLDDIDIGEDD